MPTHHLAGHVIHTSHLEYLMSAASEDIIKASLIAANDSYRAGYDAGRDIGFNEGLQAAHELIGGKSPEQILLERREKLEGERT